MSILLLGLAGQSHFLIVECSTFRSCQRVFRHIAQLGLPLLDALCCITGLRMSMCICKCMQKLHAGKLLHCFDEAWHAECCGQCLASKQWIGLACSALMRICRHVRDEGHVHKCLMIHASTLILPIASKASSQAGMQDYSKGPEKQGPIIQASRVQQRSPDHELSPPHAHQAAVMTHAALSHPLGARVTVLVSEADRRQAVCCAAASSCWGTPSVRPDGRSSTGHRRSVQTLQQLLLCQLRQPFDGSALDPAQNMTAGYVKRGTIICVLALSQPPCSVRTPAATMRHCMRLMWKLAPRAKAHRPRAGAHRRA